MKIETCTDMRASNFKRKSAFTLIELLVVIAIIAVVAGLVVGLAGVAGPEKKRKRARVELEKLLTVIEDYKAKVGVYPPHNPRFGSDQNTLLYELSGATRDGTTYRTPFYPAVPEINEMELTNQFGMGGIINSSEVGANREESAMRKQFLKDLHADQYRVNNTAAWLVVPVEGPDGKPAAWNYRVGTNAVHNPDSFDLWVEIVVKNKTNVIGNWKI